MTPEQEALVAHAEKHGLMLVLSSYHPRSWMTPKTFRESPILWTDTGNQMVLPTFGDIDDGLSAFKVQAADVAGARADFVEKARKIRPDLK